MLVTDFAIGPTFHPASSRPRAALCQVVAEALARIEAALAAQDDPAAQRSELHACRAALDVADLPGPARFAAALEHVFDLPSPPWATVQSALATLAAYLTDLAADGPDQPLALYPAYRQLVLAGGGAPAAASALFFPDLARLPPAREIAVDPLPAPAQTARLKAARLGFSRGRQKWLDSHRGGEPGGLRDMRNSLAIVEQTRQAPVERAFWWLTLAFCDGIREDLADPERRDLLGRLFDAIGARIDALLAGDGSVPADLMRDILYQVAVADGSGADSPVVAQARRWYGLAEFIPRRAADGAAWRAARDRRRAAAQSLPALADAWQSFCAGSAAALPAFHETCAVLAPLADDGEEAIAALAVAVVAVAEALRRNPLDQDDTLAETMALALALLAEALAGADRAQAMTQTARYLAARARGEAEGEHALACPPAAPPLLPLLPPRDGAARALLAAVCAQMQTNLAQTEQALEAAFHAPDQPELLAPVPLWLKQVEGALLLLDQPAAARLVPALMAGLARLSYPGRVALPSPERETAARGLAQRCTALAAYVAGLAGGVPDAAVLTLPPEPAPVPVRAAAPVENELLAIFLDEGATVGADLSRALAELRQTPDDLVALRALRRGFHTLKGSSRMVALTDFGDTAWALEDCLNAWLAAGDAASDELLALAEDGVALFERWLAAIAEGASPPDGTALAARCATLRPVPGEIGDAGAPAALDLTDPGGLGNLADMAMTPLPEELVSAIDPQLLPLFLEESRDGVAAVAEQLRLWRADPEDGAAPARLARLLHTLKGGARMAGALGIGELIHDLEGRIAAPGPVDLARIDAVEAGFDRAVALIEALGGLAEEAAPDAASEPWTEPMPPALSTLRLGPERVDRLINEAGEVAIARGRVETDLRECKEVLAELSHGIGRLRQQLGEMETLARPAPEQRQRFDELSRLLAESVGDVAAVQLALSRGLAQAEGGLAAQGRLNRALSQGLLRVRMVPFATVLERLQRLVRQTARELGKEAELHCQGEQTEVDRAVLERLVPPLEHLLRNAVAHGIETAAERRRKGKAEGGGISLEVRQQGNECQLILADDGVGLDLARIRQRGEASGLIAPGAALADDALVELIFTPGFTTASQLSAVAGRGVGLDVVRSEVTALGGRIEVHSSPDQGCRFQLVLPLTLAIGQALLLRVGEPGMPGGGRCVGIPAGLVVQAGEVPAEEMQALRREGSVRWQDQDYRWHYLPHLLGWGEARPSRHQRYWRVLVRSGEQRVALEVDALVGRQEVVLKSLGPQLERVPGMVAATVLGHGDIALIVNPLQLATRLERLPPSTLAREPAVFAPRPPTVLVADDSLSSRKALSRLLERAGYRCLSARDGAEALELLVDERPVAILVDLDMPRMDGFDLMRSLRNDEELKALPLIVVSACASDEHRRQAEALGALHFLPKPWDEARLLSLVDHYVHCPS
ncbi:hypothetical protein DLREEDagrD3_13320 [Denitratisoma sp. agr-D3]